jgi:hypothetical protein
MADDDWDQPPAIPTRKIGDHVQAVKIATEDGTLVSVPVNADANRLQSQVVAAKLRAFVDDQISMHAKTKKKMEPRELKDLVDTWAKVEENARFAYAPALTPDESGEGGTTPAQLVKAMAEGMTNAHIKSESGRMERVLQLGKAKNVTPMVEVK